MFIVNPDLFNLRPWIQLYTMLVMFHSFNIDQFSVKHCETKASAAHRSVVSKSICIET